MHYLVNKTSKGGLMKKLLLMILIPFISFADENVVAVMKYNVVNGQKSFGANWFEDANLGLMNLVLVWENYDKSVKNGFILDSAASAEFTNPKMTSDCSIKIKGTLNWMEQGTSPIGITLRGKGCQILIEESKSTPLEIHLTNVKHQIGSEQTNTLNLRIIETP